MRKVEEAMCAAVKARKSMCCGNTQVVVSSDGRKVSVYLFGNHIYSENMGCKSFTLAGWVSTTTISRLRALGVDVCRKNRKPMYESREIDSAKWYNI